MYFYVDESGHTGPNLFDSAQPILYYGVLSSRVNLDAVLLERVKRVRKKLGVQRLHAAELGIGRLVDVIPDVLPLVKQTAFSYRQSANPIALLVIAPAHPDWFASKWPFRRSGA